MKHWLSYKDTGKTKSSEKKLFQCHLVHHKYHMLWPGIKYGPHSDRWVTIRLRYDMASCLEISDAILDEKREHYRLKMHSAP
jgi:hypothetical protein